MHALNALSAHVAPSFFRKITPIYASTGLPSCALERNAHFYSNNAVPFEHGEALSHSTGPRRL